MEFTNEYEELTDEIVAVFQAAFTASEGVAEGNAVGELARQLLRATPAKDLFCFCVLSDESVAGSIVFSRVNYADDPRSVFILSPVAVAPNLQGKGIGQQMIERGLSSLREYGIDIALTYGDINFYSRIGFVRISQDEARPPHPLTHPEGWLGQSLSSPVFSPLRGTASCASALRDPAFW